PGSVAPFRSCATLLPVSMSSSAAWWQLPSTPHLLRRRRKRRVAEWAAVADRLRERFRGVATLMDEARDDVLAYLSFHKSHWSQIRSTNPLERLNREIKRRTNVASIFPNEEAIVSLVGAFLLATNHDY